MCPDPSWPLCPLCPVSFALPYDSEESMSSISNLQVELCTHLLRLIKKSQILK